MKPSLLYLAGSMLLPVCLFAADAAPASPVNTPDTAASYSASAPDSTTEENVRMGVQMTEVGLMRVLLVLDQSALPVENLITQKLTEVDFRVFDNAAPVTGRFNDKNASFTDLAGYFSEKAKAAKADLVLYAKASTRALSPMGEFSIFEGEANVRIYSGVSGELFVSEQVRSRGARNVDEVEARRAAVESAMEAATEAAIVKGLKKAHKMTVHTASISGVQSHNHLLTIMTYMQKLEGVYHVREISYDLTSKKAVLEIIGSPKTSTTWRAHLENLPKAKAIDWEYVERKQRQDHLPSWWGASK